MLDTLTRERDFALLESRQRKEQITVMQRSIASVTRERDDATLAMQLMQQRLKQQ
jgi:hypothetical protein